ncbi:hypothetical protein PNP85_10840 [Halobacterium salinarum]|uniref:hypothetical protein n=1 Tax=Halobacterium salinarum TaxID=2242 RepID=UPI000A776705|nr:hypothetical protein [Halobacterium salinarum]MDL0139999.1 hypothetical protein [Halobacterium salinarum]
MTTSGTTRSPVYPVVDGFVDPNDPEVLFDRDGSMEDLKRDGNRFERSINDIRDENE